MSQPDIEIEVFTDFVWPWCYLSTVSIDKLITEQNVKIKWAYFPLHPDTPLEGRLLTDLFRGREAQLEGLDIKSVLTENECMKVQKSENKLLSFWEYWVIKEATLKLTGEGLFGDFQGFKSISFDSKKNVCLTYKETIVYADKIIFPDNLDVLGYIATDKRKVFLATQKLKLNERGVLH